MDIVGYTDRWSVRPGDTIRAMVGCTAERFTAQVVRLVHGDDNPAGPGFKYEPVSWDGAGEYPGVVQELRPGSFLMAEGTTSHPASSQVTLCAWIHTTVPVIGGTDGSQFEDAGALPPRSADIPRPQVVVAWREPDGADGVPGAGWSLALNESGLLELSASDGGTVHRTVLDRPVEASAWWFVAARYDASERRTRLTLRSHAGSPRRPDAATTRVDVDGEGAPVVPAFRAAVHVAARAASAGGTVPAGADCFNGKIEAPRVFARWLDDDELDVVAETGSAPDLLAGWDFDGPQAETSVADVSGNGFRGELVQMPTRGVTSRRWDARHHHPALAPEQYAAVHFHDDDLEDAGWAPAFEVAVGDDWRSGVYAVWLRAGDAEDFLPFFVRPPVGAPPAPVLFLVPTFSYVAYANWELLSRYAALVLGEKAQVQDRYVVAGRLRSTYDTHTDGSGVCHASRLRPLATMRPKYDMQVLGGFQGSPHQLNADLHLLDWLEAKGYEYDVATDDDLHHEGGGLLSRYRVVVTGTHPEYWSEAMLDGVSDYLAEGGRLMYMGGNGLYSVTSKHPHRPHVVEVRRSNGTRTWEVQPGEQHHATTGELGGTWRVRGRPPQLLVGVGFAAEGLDRCAPYRRRPGGVDPKAAFVFEGIGDDEPIGDFPSLVMHHGAAGFEIDRVDRKLGSPAGTVLLASSEGLPDDYLLASDDVWVTSKSLDMSARNPLVRADLAFVEHPGGGRVFSTGSIAWCGALSHNDYDNTVSRVTANVLDEFLRTDPPAPRFWGADRAL